MPDFQLNFEARFFVGFYAVGADGAGIQVVDAASDHPDACARADWYAARDPHHTYTTYMVVDVDASRELDAWLADHRGDYDAHHPVAAPPPKLFHFDLGDTDHLPRPGRGGRR